MPPAASSKVSGEHLWRTFQSPGGESNAEFGWFRASKLSFQIGFATQRPGIASANDSQSTRARHGRRERPAGNERHWRAEDD